MRVAERVPHARDRETRLPAIVHQAAPQAFQQAAPPGARPVERQPRRADHVQPLRPPVDPEPRLVRMLHAVRARDQIPHALAALPPALRRLTRHAGQRRRAHAHSVQVPEDLGQALLGQEMRILQVHRRGGEARAVLHRRMRPGRERGPCQLAARPAAAGLRSVRGHFPARRRPVEHLPPHRSALAGGCGQQRPAAAAMRRQVALDVLRAGGLLQGGTPVPGLPARALAGAAALAARALRRRRLARPVARRRLAAASAAQAHLALQLLPALLQSADLRALPLGALLPSGQLGPQPCVLRPQPGDLADRCSLRRWQCFGHASPSTCGLGTFPSIHVFDGRRQLPPRQHLAVPPRPVQCWRHSTSTVRPSPASAGSVPLPVHSALQLNPTRVLG